MKRGLFVIVILFLLLAGCAAKDEQTSGAMEEMTESHGHGDVKITKHFDESLTMLTDKNLFSLEMVIPAKRTFKMTTMINP